MGLSFWHILVLALLALVLFGKGRVSDLMGDVAKGIKSFRKGLAEDDDEKSDARLTDEQKKANNAFDITPNSNKNEEK